MYETHLSWIQNFDNEDGFQIERSRNINFNPIEIFISAEAHFCQIYTEYPAEVPVYLPN